MPDVTFTVDGDTTNMVVNAKKGENAYKKIGEAAAQTGRKIAVVNQEIQKTGQAANNAFEKTAMSMGRTLIGAQAVARALSAARDSAIGLQEKMVSLGAEKGGFALRASRAASAGGISQALASSFIEQISPASQEERTGLLESLASSNLGLDSKRLNQILMAVSSGAFSSAEAMEAAKTGGDLDVQKRMASMSPAALRELQTRTAIDAADARSRGSFSGDAFRVGAAHQAAGDLANPVKAAVRSAVSTVDFTGAGGLGSTVRSAQDANALYLKRAADATEKLAAESKKMNTTGMTDNQ